MKKKLFLFLLFNLTISIGLWAQDTIIKRNGEKIKSKIIEIGKSHVKCKNFQDPEFATYTIEFKVINLIRFEDGTEKKFNTDYKKEKSF